MDFQTLKKINWKQPKYMLPLIIYVPLLFVGYFVIDLFHTEKAEIPDSSMATTEYLNPDLPDAKMKGDGIGNKYESMLKSYGRIDDYTAMNNIDRNNDEKKKNMIQSTAIQNVSSLNLKKPRNSLSYRDNYRKAHKRARKSKVAASCQKKTAWHAASSVNARRWTNSTVC